jgi:hypothetical protein
VAGGSGPALAGIKDGRQAGRGGRGPGGLDAERPVAADGYLAEAGDIAAAIDEPRLRATVAVHQALARATRRISAAAAGEGAADEAGTRGAPAAARYPRLIWESGEAPALELPVRDATLSRS